MGAESSREEHWQKDSTAPDCSKCGAPFTMSTRRHHCRNCGYVFCGECSRFNSVIAMRNIHTPVRVCADCYYTLRGGGGGNACQPNGESNERRRSRSVMAPSKETSEQVDADSAQFKGKSSDRWEKEGACFTGSGGHMLESIPSNEAEGGYSNYLKPPELTASGALSGGVNAAAEQMERERLVQRWAHVRQGAVFTDILLQQVERVDTDTQVEYSRETENITLQPELGADLLHTIFPIPPATEGNAQRLVEPVAPATLPGSNEATEVAMEQLVRRLALPPEVPIRKCESVLLRQY